MTLPYALAAGAVLVLAALLLALVTRRRPADVPDQPAPTDAPPPEPVAEPAAEAAVKPAVEPLVAPTSEASEYWEAPPPPVPVDRRQQPRRGGPPVAVQVTGPDGGESQLGRVMDRNSAGVRLTLERPVEVGAALRVRPTGARRDAPWIDVSVRWCVQVRGRWDVGCRFSENLPYSTLALFG